MPDENGSSRLLDRATTEFQQRRQQAAAGSTRLRDRATTAFQHRRQQAERAREVVDERSRQFADALDLEPDVIEAVQLDDRGEQFGFVPDERGESELAARFADDRPFIDIDDTLVDADPREGVRTRVDPDRKDDVADRVRADIAAEDPFAEPGDFDVDVAPGGVEAAGFSEMGARRRAGRQFEAETPLLDVDPEVDVSPVDGGFGITTPAQRRLAARQFEADLDMFGTGELDPETDIQETNGRFGLGPDPAREVAAAEIDQQFPDFSVGVDDIDLIETDSGGFEAVFEREVRR